MLNRTELRRIIASAFDYPLTDVQLARATGAAARAMIGATDTGNWHGPVEDFAYNGVGQGSFRMDRRATDAKDVGTLRMLARSADASGATSHADHLRGLADIFAQSASIDAYCTLSQAGAITSDRDPVGFVGPAIRVAYHRPTDMYVDVIHEPRDGSPVAFRSPYYGDDRCAPAFLV